MGIFDFIFRRSKKIETAKIEEKPMSPSIPKPEQVPVPDPLTEVVPDVASQPAVNAGKASIPYVPPVESTQQDVLNYLSHRPPGIEFVHGKAGCGKTPLIKKMEASNPGWKVLAPTNLAAAL